MNANNHMLQVITIGDPLIDTHVQIDSASVECALNSQQCHLCLDYATKIPINHSFQAIGGNAANVAIGLQKLIPTVALLTTLGKDTNANLIMQELKKNKINTNLITFDSRATTRYAIVLNFQGERTILSYHQKRKYVFPKKIPPTNWLYYTSLSDGYHDIQNAIKHYLTQHPTVRLAFNPGSFQLKNNLPDVREIVKITDLLIVNLQEAETILNTTQKKEKNVRTLAQQLIALGAKEVAITDAGNGAYAGNTEGFYQMPSYPVNIIAKTGAGDAFSAGYLAAKIKGYGLEESLRWGIANSCAVIQKTSSHLGLLNSIGIKKMIAAFAQIKPEKIA